LENEPQVVTDTGLRSWLTRVLDPVMPGMGPGTLRARPAALVTMVVFIALLATVRYSMPDLQVKSLLWVHLGVGWLGCLAIMVAFHGVAALRCVSRRTVFVLVVAAVVLCTFWYFGRMDSYVRYWKPQLDQNAEYSRLYGFMYFASCAVILRLLLPVFVSRIVMGLRPSDLGLSARGNRYPATLKRIWPIYLGLFLLVLPAVIYAAGTPAFQAKYPLSRSMIQHGTIALEHLVVFECFYVMVFVSGEFFWRGFLTFGTERDLGLYGLMFMIVPYVVAHYGKPLPETLGAIAAGFTLGWLALKHRSVWWGVVLHYGVALTMDLLAIYARGLKIITD